jgi:hypothetical protein
MAVHNYSKAKYVQSGLVSTNLKRKIDKLGQKLKDVMAVNNRHSQIFKTSSAEPEAEVTQHYQESTRSVTKRQV